MRSIAKLTAVVTVAVAPVMLAQPVSASATGSNSAFGIAAHGLVPISPVPAVAAATGANEPATKSLADLPANSLAKVRVLGVSADSARSRASVADLAVAKIGLRASTVTATCVNGQGNARLVNAVIAGRKLDSSPRPNTTVPVTLDKLGAVSVTLNKQERRSDGRLTTTAIAVSLQAAGQSQTIDVSSATCGRPVEQSSRVGNSAPVPTPVKRDLPVTG